MADCIFCKIVEGQIPSYKVWESEHYIAILDIFPVRTGQTLVISKQHRPSYIFSLPEAEVVSFFKAVREVALKLDKVLGTTRTIQVAEGLGVSHAHVKLYPINEEIEGGLVHIGPKADEHDLQQLADKIRRGA